MNHKIQYLKVKFCLGSISVLVGLLGATIALFHWVESTELQYLFGGLSRYVLGFGGFAAMIFGALLANDAWVLRDVLRGRYEGLTKYSMNASSSMYIKEKTPEVNYLRNRKNPRGKVTRPLRKPAASPYANDVRFHAVDTSFPASLVRLAVVPKPAEGSRVIIEGKETPVVERRDNIRMVCDRCGELLVDGVNRGLIRNAVIRCPTCGAYCDTLHCAHAT
jgi:hypothetical protein